MAVYALDVTIVRERTNEAEEGRVFRQDPEANADSFRLGEITLYVSDGPPLVEIPQFFDRTVEEAQQLADELGIELRFDRRWPFSGGPEGKTVIDQSIAPGEMVEIGETVYLIYD